MLSRSQVFVAYMYSLSIFLCIPIKTEIWVKSIKEISTNIDPHLIEALCANRHWKYYRYKLTIIMNFD